MDLKESDLHIEHALKQKYLSLAKSLHPDSGGSEASFKLLQEAYEVLQKASFTKIHKPPSPAVSKVEMERVYQEWRAKIFTPQSEEMREEYMKQTKQNPIDPEAHF